MLTMKRHSYRLRGGVFVLLGVGAACFSGCSGTQKVHASEVSVTQETTTNVGVALVSRKPMDREITISSELVPFQEIDVYAKESGFVRELNVDYGSRVQKGQLLAVLEIPELQMQLQQDAAAIEVASDQVLHAQKELNRVEAQHNVLHLQYKRLKGVSDSRPGLVAEQEVDDAQGRDLASEAQIEASKSAMATAQSQLDAARAKEKHDQILYDYANIRAPFAGIVTQRFANLGTLVQAGTNSSTQAMPLVRLSQDDMFRLVIPVPESYVKYIRVGDPVQVKVPSLDRTFPGRVARFSVDVTQDTRTMHTEVDVANPSHQLMPGIYADATLTLERKNDALTVPLQAVDRNGEQSTIMLVDPSNRVQLRTIELGLQNSTDAEVVGGLNEGDRVVVSDRSSLKQGAIVHPEVTQLLEYQGAEKTQ
jgi:RND family efflux transporter MFP subunit